MIMNKQDFINLCRQINKDNWNNNPKEIKKKKNINSNMVNNHEIYKNIYKQAMEAFIKSINK